MADCRYCFQVVKSSTFHTCVVVVECRTEPVNVIWIDAFIQVTLWPLDLQPDAVLTFSRRLYKKYNEISLVLEALGTLNFSGLITGGFALVQLIYSLLICATCIMSSQLLYSFVCFLSGGMAIWLAAWAQLCLRQPAAPPFHFTSSPPPPLCSIKETGNQTP